MAKSITTFVCQECGYESGQWLGRCPECGNWNSLKEFRMAKAGKTLSAGNNVLTTTTLTPKVLSEITSTEKTRILTGFGEMDGVLGGGLVEGAVVLIAGDPGIGKSTLLLQTCINIARDGRKVLYISGEESMEQIKMRAERIASGEKLDELLLLSLSQSDLIPDIVEKVKPSLVVIDSIQTMESESVSGLSGSVPQIRYATATFIKAAKSQKIPFILVGHVTKEGMVAGPMALSHMVDTVLFLEGEKFTKTRILRSLKNRFGPVDEVGIFVMDEKGLNEVTHPEQVFLNQHSEDTPGSVLVVVMEGTRPFLIEIQALVIYSKFSMPKRVASGIDSKRLELLLAVLQKHCRLPLETMDVFVNIAGGMRVDDPAADLGICLAVYSSLTNKPLPKTVGISEVGLLGELRIVTALDKRLREATKLGFTNIISSDKFKTLPHALKALQ